MQMESRKILTLQMKPTELVKPRPMSEAFSRCVQALNNDLLDNFKKNFNHVVASDFTDFGAIEDDLVCQTGAFEIITLCHATILHLAVWYSAHSIITYLLENYCDMLIDKKTIEGLTSVHVAAAIGDFVAADLLCRAGANLRIKDNLGRTPLHYAVRDDPKVAIVLCSYDDSLVQILDQDNKNPFHYAMEHRNSACLEFLVSVARKSNSRKMEQYYAEPRNFSNTMSEMGSLWIPFNLKISACLKPTKNPKNPAYCTCNTSISNHSVITNNQQLLKVLHKRNEQFIELPTNVFGELEIRSNTYIAEYVRVSNRTSADKLLELFNIVWGLSRPQLVITFYGDYVDSLFLKEKFRRLIWKISDNTVTWTLTNGLTNDISVIVSEVVKEYIQAYGVGRVQAFGIVPWNMVSHKECLISPSYTGLFPANYSVIEEESKLHRIMDTNLTNYIFVDTFDEVIDHYEYTYRASVEQALRNWKHKSEDSHSFVAQTPVQMCGIVCGGDEATLKAVYGAVKNRIPFVLMRNTGGLADILVQCIEDTELGYKVKYKRAISEGSSSEEIFQLSPAKIKQTVECYWDSINQPEFAVLMIQELLDLSHFLSICESEDDDCNELDYHILSLLINPLSDEDYEPGKLNEALLAIAIALNRSDIARSNVFVDGAKLDVNLVAKYVGHLLLHNKVNFLKLFIDKGFSLEDYLTPEILEYLYTTSLHSEDQHEILQNVIQGFTKVPDRVNLSLVGRTLKTLIGGCFHSVYLDPVFLMHCNTGSDEKIFQNPATDLFIWSLLTERFEMAKFFWTQIQDPLPGALLAALLLRRLTLYTNSLVTKDEIYECSKLFETKAYDLLSECFDDNPAMAFEAIVRERNLYGNMSCLMLAAEGKSMNFISHRCAEQYLEKVWYGAISLQTKWITSIFALFIGLVFPPLIPFTLKFDETQMQSKPLDDDTIFKHQKRSEIVLSVEPERKPMQIHQNRIKKTSRNSGYFLKLREFYRSPYVRFSYTTIAYLTFLCLFTYVLLFANNLMVPATFPQNLILYIWVLSFLAEDIRQAFTTDIPFKTYIKRLWKFLELIAITTFFIGTVFQVLVIVERQKPQSGVTEGSSNTLLEVFNQLSRIFYGFSLCIFFHRTLELFTVNIRLGPMVIMVQSMLMYDLLPFLTILLVVLIGFAILQWVVSFVSTASLNHGTNVYTLFSALQLAYFQLFGEYQLELFQGEKLSSCEDSGINCPGPWAEWLSPLLLGIYVILTQVLLLNLVIAMFATTYTKIETASTKYWALQRYSIMREYVDRSPLPPPFIILWHIYLLLHRIVRACQGKPKESYHPFKKSYKEAPMREHRLTHWEKLRFWDYHRYVLQGHERSHKTRLRSINVRTTVVAQRGHDNESGLLSAIQEHHQTTQQNISEVSEKANKIKQIEQKVDRIMKILTDFVEERTTPNYRDPTYAHPLPLSRPLGRKYVAGPRPGDRLRRSTNIMGPYVQNPPRNLLTKQQSIQFVVLSDGSHRLATFSPPSADRTPYLFPTPLPWDKGDKPSSIAWKPSCLKIDNWTESAEFSEVTSKWKPIFIASNTKYIPPDPETGCPRNPGGRTGVSGRGALPRWGPNPAIIFIVTKRCPEQLKQDIQKASVFEFAAYRYRQGAQLPWFLVQHPDNCDQLSCANQLLSILLDSRLQQMVKLNPENEKYKTNADILKSAPREIIHTGYLEDTVNTDNAWIEPIGFYVDLSERSQFDENIILQLMDVEQIQMRWLTEWDIRTTRKSHQHLLDKITAKMQSRWT